MRPSPSAMVASRTSRRFAVKSPSSVKVIGASCTSGVAPVRPGVALRFLAAAGTVDLEEDDEDEDEGESAQCGKCLKHGNPYLVAIATISGNGPAINVGGFSRRST